MHGRVSLEATLGLKSRDEQLRWFTFPVMVWSNEGKTSRRRGPVLSKRKVEKEL
jgi:hypothetical protein